MAVGMTFGELQLQIIMFDLILHNSVFLCWQADELTFLVKSECFSGGTVTKNENRLAISVLNFVVSFSVCTAVLWNVFVGIVNLCSFLLLFIYIPVLYFMCGVI